MPDFGDYETTMRIEAAITSIVKRELASQKPPTRIAEVKSIDRVNRKITVVFTGELEEVVVPYLATAPAEEGQFVRIGGTTHDRYVEDVMGESESESRILELEKELARSSQRAYANAGPQSNFDLRDARTIPNNTSAGSSSNNVSSVKNITIAATGSFEIQIEGMYEYAGTLMVDAMRNNVSNMWIRIRLQNGVEFDHAKSNHHQLTGSGEYFVSSPMILVGQIYLKPGDKIYMTGFSQLTTEVSSGGTSLSVNLIDPA